MNVYQKIAVTSPAPFDRCLQLLAEAADLAKQCAGQMDGGWEFVDMLDEALAVGRKSVWPLSDEQRTEAARDHADWMRHE